MASPSGGGRWRRVPWIWMFLAVLAVAGGVIAVVSQPEGSEISIPGFSDDASSSGSDQSGAEPSSCTAYKSGAAVTVTITSTAGAEACDEFIRAASGSDALWSPQPSEANYPSVREGIICDLTMNDTEIVVRDPSIDTFEAKSICGRYVASGWTQQPLEPDR